ncbi:MAG: hypothetical protein PWP52_1081 [Bacteroidales bacterium]|jgi:hypothetical protein|nr:hypothetical protein [Bacteroidales bacterium]
MVVINAFYSYNRFCDKEIINQQYHTFIENIPELK